MERGRAYLLAGAAAVAEVAGYLAWRARMLRWGASRDEAADAIPGDDRAQRPQVQSTRAITIDAPPQRVWPWIVQVGIERPRFYSHDRDEWLLGRARYGEERHSATRIPSEPQGLKIDDPMPYGAAVLTRVDEIEPRRHLVAGEAFVLGPLPGERTRLIVRYPGMVFISAAAAAIRPGAALRTRLIHLAIRIPGVELIVGAIDFFISDSLHDHGRPHPWLTRGDASWPGPVRHQGWPRRRYTWRRA
jgi:hypothetical protein